MMSHKMSVTDDKEMVRLAFRTLDKDGSGTIATNEFKHLMTHIGKITVWVSFPTEVHYRTKLISDQHKNRIRPT